VRGNGALYSVSVGALNGYAGTADVSVTGLPSGAEASFAPASITGSGSSTLTVSTAASTPTGSYPLTVRGTDRTGSPTRSTSVTLIVTAPDFALSASPSSASTIQGSSASYGVSVSPLNGYAGTVGLAVSGLPIGATPSWTPSSTISGGSGSSTLIVATTGSTPAGSYPLTITGTDSTSSLIRSTSVTLVVSPPVVTAFPSSATVVTGSLRGGSATSLKADDTSYYEVYSTGYTTQTARWQGTFAGVPSTLTNLKVTYKGRNSRTCTQTVSIFNWQTSLWVDLDIRSVGTSDLLIADKTPSGTASAYVSGGQLKVRVRCSTTAGSFYASGNLLKIAYTP
jgi:hypothetical protein